MFIRIIQRKNMSFEEWYDENFPYIGHSISRDQTAEAAWYYQQAKIDGIIAQAEANYREYRQAINRLHELVDKREGWAPHTI